MPTKPQDPLLRFSKKYTISSSGCWIWLGAKKPSGYGNFFMGGKYVSAHRASWRLRFGDIPDGLFVLHKCDTPSCVNPDHLFLGTPLDNMRDMHSKGRSTGPYLGGEHAPCSKLNFETAQLIRRRLLDGALGQDLAKEFGVAGSIISQIKNWNIWRKPSVVIAA